MTALGPRNDTVFQVLSAAFPMFERQDDLRFEVSPGASFYVRRRERRRGEDIARINRIFIRNFPNLDELNSYIEDDGIRMDHTQRDYLIGPKHIDGIIGIVGRPA